MAEAQSDRLETPKQLAGRIGISERQVRQLIHTRQSCDDRLPRSHPSRRVVALS
jgi:hypothetical protein